MMGYNKEEKNGRWRGGRRISLGYVLIRCPSHPRAHKQGKYIAEHILVMEKHLGRYLTKDEIVHHINGIKNDNRIDNLELMTKRHHMSHHKLGLYRRDHTNTKCVLCTSTKTSMEKIASGWRAKWYHYNKSWICKRCYNNLLQSRTK